MKLLAEGAKELGINLSARQLEQFELYYRELVQWNGRANLTAITGYEETQVRHFLDSLTVCLPYRKEGCRRAWRKFAGWWTWAAGQAFPGCR